MAKHHIVQDKYLAQWKRLNTANHLNLYIIPKNKFEIGNTKSKLFWRDDFNLLKGDGGERSYLPEHVTAIIDAKGIEAIRKIDTSTRNQLSGEDRSCIAFYIALQHIRTPRFREESDKMIQAQIRYFMRKDIASPNKVRMTKEELLSHKPINKSEAKALEELRGMSEEEIQQLIFNSIHSDDVKIRLTNTGHSKSILNIETLAKGLFEVQWVFLVAPTGVSFVTSDNPCFTVGPKIMNGLLSPPSMVFFPLRPDVCVCAKPSNKTQLESFMDMDEKEVRDINSLILSCSYQCLVAKTKEQLQDLTRDFNHSDHEKSRKVSISERGSYVLFNLE